MHKSLLALPLLLAACSPKTTLTYDAETSISIFETLAADDMKGRRTGTEGNAKARAFLKQEIATLGFDSVYDTTFTTKPRPNREGKIAPDAPVYEAVNINALIDVDDNDKGPLLVITAHYDHLGEREGKIFNGADDNACFASVGSCKIITL
mgnify:FL=1